jgi:hypothetical protein
MALDVQEKAQIVADYQQAVGDTGSPEVQVALLTANINKLPRIRRAILFVGTPQLTVHDLQVIKPGGREH